MEHSADAPLCILADAYGESPVHIINQINLQQSAARVYVVCAKKATKCSVQMLIYQ